MTTNTTRLGFTGLPKPNLSVVGSLRATSQHDAPSALPSMVLSSLTPRQFCAVTRPLVYRTIEDRPDQAHGMGVSNPTSQPS